MNRRTISPKGKILRKKIPFINIFPVKWKRSKDFCQAWMNWAHYRNKIIKRELTKYAATRGRNKLIQHSMPIAIAMINQSRENTWTGLFELRDQEQELNDEQDNEQDGINVGFQNR